MTICLAIRSQLNHDSVRDEITALWNCWWHSSKSIDRFCFFFLFLHPTRCRVPVLRDDRISASVSHSHTVFRHVTRGRPSLMPCRMQKRIMAYAPCCVSESRASDSSRFWRWKRERANWNLCLVHVTGADVYDFAKRELRATRVFSVRICAVFFERRERGALAQVRTVSVCTFSEKRINFSWFGRRYSLIAIELNRVCTIYERAKNFRIQRYMSLIEGIRSPSF